MSEIVYLHHLDALWCIAKGTRQIPAEFTIRRGVSDVESAVYTYPARLVGDVYELIVDRRVA